MLPYDEIDRFELKEEFLSDYQDKEPNWGYGDFSKVTYRRTYSREKDDGTQERWFDTVKRVVEGVFNTQKAHCKTNHLPWNEEKARRTAHRMFERMYDMKWLPPGRGLWMMGTDFVENRGSAPLNNCGFRSTENIDENFADPFCWAFTMSMLGVGVGFDTRGKGKVTIEKPREGNDIHVIGDSREGWTKALRRLLNSFVGDATLPSEWDYSEIRPKGAPIESFGGTASGPGPLKEMLETLEELYRDYVGQRVDSRLIVDTMNISGKCVVSGGVRRTAQAALSDKNDQQFLDLKQDEEKLKDYRWASNNSIFAEVGMDYDDAAERTASNGEPGYAWLENMRKFGRIKDEPNWDDRDVKGFNPCFEQTLEDLELCTLCETFPAHHDSFEDFRKTLKVAYLYAKTVTLIPTHNEKTNQVMLKNRRIGCSMSGIVQAIEKRGLREHLRWCDEGYEYIQNIDRIYSDWLGIPESIKTTSVKPSGTVSCLAGSTPGIHFEHSPYFVRRMRVQNTSKIWKAAEEAGYPVEDDEYARDTKVIEFPLRPDYLNRSKYDVSIWEMVKLTALHQKWWSDNGVSATISFSEDEKDQIPYVLEAFERELKGISFLPEEDHGYDQPPYEAISKEAYEERKKSVEKIDLLDTEHEKTDKFCGSEGCEVNLGEDTTDD